MSYVNKKGRIFLDRGDIKPERRRSEARLKTYPSAIDIRAWCDIVEDRRQHILELITKGKEPCFGKLIPLDAIINALLAGRVADINKLKKCLAQLWKFLEDINLNEDNRRKLAALRLKMDPICVGEKEKIEEMGNDCVAKERHDRERAEVDALIKEGGTYKVTAKGPARVITRVKGFRPPLRQPASDGVGGSVTTRTQGPVRVKTVVKNAFPNSKEKQLDQPPQRQPEQYDQRNSKQQNVNYENPVEEQKSTSNRQPLGQTKNQYQPVQAESLQEQYQEKSSRRSSLPQPYHSPPSSAGRTRAHSVDGHVSSNQRYPQNMQAMQPSVLGDSEIFTDFSPVHHSSLVPGVKPAINIEAPTLNETGDVYVQLEARETLCNELRTSLESMRSERDHLKIKYEATVAELEALKKLNVSTSIIPSSCKEEIEALELEIKVMRSGNLSPDQEAEVIKKEVEVLKKYCQKLKSVEDENEKLKLERDTLKSQVVLSDETGTEKPKSVKDNLNRQVAGIVGEASSKESLAHIEELKGKLENLEQITRERDMLANKVQRLEKELLKYGDLPEDIDVYRNRSKMLDSALEERDRLSKKVEQIKEIEEEFNQLKKKSSRVDQLEEELKLYSKNDKNIGSELKKTKSRCTCLERELQNVKMERDSMRTRIEYMQKEIETLRAKAKEVEILRLERDKLQIKLNELSHLQVQHDNLRLKCKCLESIAAEKEIYKQKYEEILSIECQGDSLRSQVEAAKNVERERNALVKQVGDLESCICDQEEEIKKLMMQIDTLCRCKDDNQCRMKEALASMRAEIEKKDNLIAESEQKLATLQTQLKSSIQGVSCETTCYKTRIEDLERELKQCHAQIDCLKKQLSSVKDVERLTKSECENVVAMKQELEAAKLENKKLREIANKMVTLTGDEHVQSMLKHSQCAVKRVVEELGRQYKEWDNMKHNHKRGIYAQINKHCPCSCKYKRIETCQLSDSENEKLVDELEDIQREKEKLEQLVKQIQNDKLSCPPQGELISLRVNNAKLQEQLKNEVKLRKDLEKNMKTTSAR